MRRIFLKKFSWEITKYMYPKPFDNIQEINKLIEESIIKVKNEVSVLSETNFIMIEPSVFLTKLHLIFLSRQMSGLIYFIL